MIQISNKFYDKTFKLQSTKHFESLCFNCGIFIEFDHFLNTELVDDGGTTYHMDISFNDKRGFIVIVEFQSSIVSEEDIDRFMKYAVLTHLKEGKNVHIYVISTVEEQDRVIRRNWNFFGEFTIYIKSLKAIDGDITLNMIKQKIKNNELNNDDITDLETIIFMKSEKTVVELLREICILVNEIENIDEKIIYDLKTFLIMYIKKFVEDEYEAERLMELIGMRKDLFHRTVDTIRNQGIKEGEAKGEIKGEIRGKRATELKFVRDLLDNDFDLDDISNIFSLEKSYLSDLLK